MLGVKQMPIVPLVTERLFARMAGASATQDNLLRVFFH